MSYCRRDDLSRADIDVFTTELADITARINNENKESYIIGDFNIDLLKFQRYDKTKYFSESMLTTGCLPVITKPTTITEHSATLLDHIIRCINVNNRISASDNKTNHNHRPLSYIT